MDSTDGSIHAQKPASFLPQRVNIKGISTELSKAALKIGTGNPWASIPDVLAALTNIGTLTESQRAYKLVYRGLIAAIVELVQSAAPVP